MTAHLASKVVVVTRGSSRIARAVAERVAADGAAAVIGARRAGVGGEVAAGIRAGGVRASGLVHEIDDAAWRAELDQNLSSVFYSLKHQVPAMLASGGGAIVNNAALAGVVGVPGMAAYTAAKHGVVGRTRAAAPEGAGQGCGSTRWSPATWTRRCSGACWVRPPVAS
jgi:NAD(P)-dependent dehydrogenase (short-subunit alcohol dehydrogenase family)